MSVSQILAQKGRSIISAKPEDTLADVATLLAENKIGAVLVLDDNKDICGITSERDIVRLVASQGAIALGKPVSDCMTNKVTYCEDSDSINTAMEKMTSGRFRHLPVLKNGSLVGLISIGDVVKRKIEEVERDSEELKRYIAS